MGPLLALLEPLRVLLERLWGSLGRPLGDLLGGLLGVPKPLLKHPLSWRANSGRLGPRTRDIPPKTSLWRNPPAPDSRSNPVAIPPPGPSPFIHIYFHHLQEHFFSTRTEAQDTTSSTRGAFRHPPTLSRSVRPNMGERFTSPLPLSAWGSDPAHRRIHKKTRLK